MRRSRRDNHDRRAGRSYRRTVLKIDSETPLEGREPPGAAGDRSGAAETLVVLASTSSAQAAPEGPNGALGCASSARKANGSM